MRAAGIGRGMRVLDLGSALGHVATLAAEMVGPEGAVTGLDASGAMVELEDSRRRAAGLQNVRFVQGDVHTFRHDRGFDALIGRLILFHLPDPAAVLRHHLEQLEPGGTVAMLDFDIGGARTDPAVPLASTALGWVMKAFRAAGAHPAIGARLAPLLVEAGVADVQWYGIQECFAPGDPRGPALLSGVVQTLLPQLVKSGIATPDEVGIATLRQRIADAVDGANASFFPPTLMGAWGRRS